MATIHPSCLIYASCSSQTAAKVATGARSHSMQRLQGPFRYSTAFNVTSNEAFHKSRLSISCAMNMARGQPGDSEKINLEYLREKTKKLWENAPQPVKSFPWITALTNFVQLILGLTFEVVKYLSVPLLFVSSLSEMSYCAHQKKLFLVPFPLLVGVAIAHVLNETSPAISPPLKDDEVPWSIAGFFTLLKLAGPYYPFWGRIFIPHLANGALWYALSSALPWSRRPGKHQEQEEHPTSVLEMAVNLKLINSSSAENLEIFIYTWRKLPVKLTLFIFLQL